MNEGQLALLAERTLTYYEAKARERQLAGKRLDETDLPAVRREGKEEKGEAAQHAAAAVGASTRSVQRANVALIALYDFSRRRCCRRARPGAHLRRRTWLSGGWDLPTRTTRKKNAPNKPPHLQVFRPLSHSLLHREPGFAPCVIDGASVERVSDLL
jgi:hypothetical protein